MTVLCYTIVDNFGECRSIFGKGTDPLEIRLEGAKEGIVHIGGIMSRAENGIAHISLSSLADGEYTPYVKTGQSTVELEQIKIRGSRVTLTPLKEQRLRRLLVRTEKLEKELADALLKIEEMQSKIERTFTF